MRFTVQIKLIGRKISFPHRSPDVGGTICDQNFMTFSQKLYLNDLQKIFDVMALGIYLEGVTKTFWINTRRIFQCQ